MFLYSSVNDSDFMSGFNLEDVTGGGGVGGVKEDLEHFKHCKNSFSQSVFLFKT